MKFALLFFITFSFAHAEPLTVFVREGLVLRDSPSKTGKRMAVIPFGTQVIATKVADLAPITVNGITATYVGVEYQGKTGFVFAGFLSRMPKPPKNINSVTDYFKAVYGPGKTTKLKASIEHSETQKEHTSLKGGIEIAETLFLGAATP